MNKWVFMSLLSSHSINDISEDQWIVCCCTVINRLNCGFADWEADFYVFSVLLFGQSHLCEMAYMFLHQNLFISSVHITLPLLSVVIWAIKFLCETAYMSLHQNLFIRSVLITLPLLSVVIWAITFCVRWHICFFTRIYS